MTEVGSRGELKISVGVLFHYHNANSTLIEKLLRLMDWRIKIHEEADSINRDQRRTAQPRKGEASATQSSISRHRGGPRWKDHRRAGSALRDGPGSCPTKANHQHQESTCLRTPEPQTLKHLSCELLYYVCRASSQIFLFPPPTTAAQHPRILPARPNCPLWTRTIQ